MQWLIDDLYRRYFTTRRSSPKDEFEFVALCRSHAHLRVGKPDFAGIRYDVYGDWRPGFQGLTLVQLLEKFSGVQSHPAYLVAINRLKRAGVLKQKFDLQASFDGLSVASLVPNRRRDQSYVLYHTADDFLELCELYKDLGLTSADVQLGPDLLFGNWLDHVPEPKRVANPTIGDYVQYVTPPTAVAFEEGKFAAQVRSVIIGRLIRHGVLAPYFKDTLQPSDFVLRRSSPANR